MANLTRTRRARRDRRRVRQNIAGAALIALSISFLAAWAYVAAQTDCRTGHIESAAICHAIR